jgi:hypothetical protein
MINAGALLDPSRFLRASKFSEPFKHEEQDSSIENDTMLVLIDNDWIEINPEQAWFWTREWQSRHYEAEQDLIEGRYEEFDTMDEFIGTLEARINDE